FSLLTFLPVYSSETGRRHTEIMNAAVLQPVQEALAQKIQVKNLNFYYGGFHALKDINLQIPERRVTAFIGPSGCGKSTLLRTFNRMYALYPKQEARGEILIDGEDILSPRQDLNRLRAKVGMVFQKPTPFPMSINDNIAFGVRLYESLSMREMEERVEWALRKAALWEEVKDKLKQSGTSLSGGQQQRLCIARGIAVKPEVLLLDEPASALDPISTGRIEELVHELKNDYTIVIVTHNMQQAARVSDYTAYMYLGEMVEFGVTDEVFIKPRKKETEDYITVRRQPAASDLRLIMAISKTVTDLERIGDEAEKIARMSRQIHERGHADLHRFATVRHAAHIALSMLRQALDAFARLDAADAASIIRQDVAIDTEFRAILRQLITFMMEDPRTISTALEIVWIAKAIERIGDHAKNIAE